MWQTLNLIRHHLLSRFISVQSFLVIVWLEVEFLGGGQGVPTPQKITYHKIRPKALKTLGDCFQILLLMLIKFKWIDSRLFLWWFQGGILANQFTSICWLLVKQKLKTIHKAHYWSFWSTTKKRKKNNREVVFSSRSFPNTLKYWDQRWDFSTI